MVCQPSTEEPHCSFPQLYSLLLFYHPGSIIEPSQPVFTQHSFLLLSDPCFTPLVHFHSLFLVFPLLLVLVLQCLQLVLKMLPLKFLPFSIIQPFCHCFLPIFLMIPIWQAQLLPFFPLLFEFRQVLAFEVPTVFQQLVLLLSLDVLPAEAIVSVKPVLHPDVSQFIYLLSLLSLFLLLFPRTLAPFLVQLTFLLVHFALISFILIQQLVSLLI